MRHTLFLTTILLFFFSCNSSDNSHKEIMEAKIAQLEEEKTELKKDRETLTEEYNKVVDNLSEYAPIPVDLSDEKNKIEHEINKAINRQKDNQQRERDIQALLSESFASEARVVETSPEGNVLNGLPQGGFPLVGEWLFGLSISRTISRIKVKEIKKEPSTGLIEEITMTEFHRDDIHK